MAQEAPVPATTTIEADSPAHAVDALVDRYGYAITFEGHRYVYEGDFQDMPESLRRDLAKKPNGPAPRVRMSKADQTTLTVPSTREISSSEMAAILQRLVGQANRNGKGHYRLEQNEDVFDVIPTEVRDLKGNWVVAKPIFDTRITLPRKERSALMAVEAVFREVAASTGIPITLFTAPRAMLSDFRAAIGADNEVARVVLARALTGMNGRLTWRVFYDQATKHYFMIISVVPDLAPKTQEVTQPVAAPSENRTQRPGSPSSAPPPTARPR